MNMQFRNNICHFRERKGLTREQLAEQLGVSLQTESSWELGAVIPDVPQLMAIAGILRVTVDELISESVRSDFEYRDRFFDEEQMYSFIRNKAESLQLNGTLNAMAYARSMHAGQFRKNLWSKTPVPYINHPLTMCCQAISMGIQDDDVLSAIMLHDVYEDCGVKLTDMPCNDRVRNAVMLLSHNNGTSTDAEYYCAISKDPLASLVKCLDRCNNISCMASGFTRKKMLNYVYETERYIIPILENLSELEPGYSRAEWLLRYQMYALLETYKRLV